MTDEERNMAHLRNMATSAENWSNRIGSPGCAARRQYADDAAALRWALEQLAIHLPSEENFR